jgi:glycosyltransferase involved in cell wall biosynthesis
VKITVIILTKNEELNIKDCLETVKWADEILIIDSGSTDRTAEIASGYKTKFIADAPDSFAEKRTLSLKLASNDWIFFLDADERATPELQKELMEFEPIEGVNGYILTRRNFYFGQWLRHSGVYPDKHIRFFNRKFAAITPRLLHEGVEITGGTAEMKGEFLHYTFRDMEQMMDKINYYSTLEALDKLQHGKKISKAGVFTHAVSTFLRVYLSRKGFKDGSGGFFISFCYAVDNFLTHLKLLKLQGKI